eukprot:SAG31_NODE_1782_length_7281_cov_5.022139_1_plen_570_part_00
MYYTLLHQHGFAILQIYAAIVGCDYGSVKGAGRQHAVEAMFEHLNSRSFGADWMTALAEALSAKVGLAYRCKIIHEENKARLGDAARAPDKDIVRRQGAHAAAGVIKISLGTSPIGIAKMQDEAGFVAVYIDDLIVFSNSIEEHRSHLLQVMRVCSDEGLFLNTAKSHIFCEYTRYLGAVCGNGQLFMDPNKVEAIVRMPYPKQSQTAIREFLGAASFYRRWIDSYARITEPLQELLKDNAKGRTMDMWAANKSKYETVVDKLKRILCSYPVLRQPNFHKPFLLYTDASDYAIGGVLCQLDETTGRRTAIHYASRSLINAEKKYSVQEKEALAIVFSVKKFRKYLLGSRFKIRVLTDHRTLESLTNSREVAGRMARWAMIMSEYNYSVEYIPGVSNTAADSLSRLIDMSEERWKTLTLEDRDSDENSPFLVMWPELHLLCNVSWFDEESLDRESFTPGNFTSIFSKEELEEIARIEELDSMPGNSWTHESVLFALPTLLPGERKVLKIHSGLYPKCKDFADLHAFLKDVSVRRETNEVKRLSKKRNRTRSDKNGSKSQKLCDNHLPSVS